ncbi:MAG TPA: antitoxin VapB family protein [Candidatus Nanoarchaeia archaeon]|nr:antitoxin VapB family protein [Candidatus Nanoarchaeia archaeon]
MSSVNISVKKDAYEFLRSLKTNEQSFSDVILGFKTQKGPLDFFGVLKEKDWAQAERQIGGLRASLRRRLNR